MLDVFAVEDEKRRYTISDFNKRNEGHHLRQI